MKKFLSIVLTLLMLVSVLCVAPVSAAEVETAQTGVTMTGGEVLYLNPSMWDVDGARFAAYFYDIYDVCSWASMTKVEGEDSLYEVTVPAGYWTNVIFCRMNGFTTENNWDNKWNQSADLVYDGTNNCFTPNYWDGANSTWSVYTPPVVNPEPEIPEPEIITVYFANTRGNWTDLGAHFKDGTVYLPPYVETDENGVDIYSYEVTVYGYENERAIFFGAPNGDTQNSEQTEVIPMSMLYDGVCVYVTDETVDGYDDIFKVTLAPYVPTSTPEPAETYTVYFVDYVDNFAEVYAYAWTNTDNGDDIAVAWPGVKMEPTGEVLSENAEQAGGLVYSATFDKAYENIIFSGINSDGESAGQTADLTFEADKYCYWGNELWYDSIADIEAEWPYVEPSTEDEEPDEPDDPAGEYITVYFQNNWMWSDVCVYFWGSATEATHEWPGTAMDYYDNDGIYDVYSAQIPADVEGFLINGIKDDGTGQRDKTPDITEGFYDGICYYMMWNDGNAVGSMDITELFPDMSGGEEGDEPEKAPSVLGSTATLDSKIGVNFFFDVDSVMDDENAKVQFTVKGETIEVPVSELSYGKYGYYYTIELAAKEMTEVVTAKIVATDFESEAYDYTVEDYALYILNSDDEKYAAAKDLVKAMLNYGAAAQDYFGYNTDNPANRNLSEEDRVVVAGDFSEYAPVIEGEGEAICFYGASLILDSDTFLRFYFTVDESKIPEGEMPAVTINGLAGATLVKNGTLWNIENDTVEDGAFCFAPNQFDTTFVIAMGNGHTVTYSAYSFIHAAQQTGKTNLVKLANALGAYSNAAVNYQPSTNN